jgi:hypothetical protein
MDRAENEPPSSLETRALAAIPEVWAELVRLGDSVLVERVCNLVERRVGARPDPGAVAAFLAGLANPSHLETQRTSETHPGIRGPSIFPPPSGTASTVG